MASDLQRILLVPNKRYKASGIKSYAFALQKFNFKPTKQGPYFSAGLHGQHRQQKLVRGKSRLRQFLRRLRDADQAGDVPAEGKQNDSMYLCPVTIGTPGQQFMLDFDSGSSDLWVWSTELPKSVNRKAHSVYDSSKSSTFKRTAGAKWNISYGDGSSASGDVGTDNINVGGLIIKNQAVELAKNLSAEFQQDSSDGLFGLAFGKINTVKPKHVNTPVENMIAQSDIPKDHELFTVYLGSYKDVDDSDHGKSFYTFGYIDQTALGGQTPVYTPVDNSQGFWMFQSPSAVVNGQQISRTGNKAIADTGTTLALVDDSVCEAIYQTIPGAKYDETQQGYVFPTNSTINQLPVVSFAVGDHQFEVQKEDLGFADAGNGMSYGGIQSRGDLTFDILGDTFLKAIYAIFDQGNLQFGAVQRNDPTQKLGF